MIGGDQTPNTTPATPPQSDVVVTANKPITEFHSDAHSLPSEVLPADRPSTHPEAAASAIEPSHQNPTGVVIEQRQSPQPQYRTAPNSDSFQDSRASQQASQRPIQHAGEDSRLAHQIRPAGYVQQPVIQGPIEPFPPSPIVQATPAPTRKLTLHELEQIAFRNNPSLAAASGRVEAARGKWLQVGLPPNTVVGYSGQQLGSGGQAEQHGLFIGQEFVRGGKLGLNRAVVTQEIEKLQQVYAAQQQRVRTDVRLAYYDVLVAQRRNETAEALRGIAQKAIETAEALFRAKEVSQVDVMRARIELQTAQLMIKRSRNMYDAAWSRLVAVLGVQTMQPQPLEGEVEDATRTVDRDEALAKLLAENPEMAAAISERERARCAVVRARAEPIPNLDVQTVLQSDNGTGSSNANLQVTFPIPYLNRNQGGIRQAQSEYAVAARQIDQLRLSYAQQFAEVYQRYATAQNQVEDYSRDGGILANSQSTLDFVRRGYEAGELSYLDLINAQRTYSETNLAYIEALGDHWKAIVEIDGLLLKDSLQTKQ